MYNLETLIEEEKRLKKNKWISYIIWGISFGSLMLTPHWFDITPIDKGLLIVGTIIATIIYVIAGKKVKKIKEEIASTKKE